jgi:hypothetical protein
MVEDLVEEAMLEALLEEALVVEEAMLEALLEEVMVVEDTRIMEKKKNRLMVVEDNRLMVAEDNRLMVEVSPTEWPMALIIVMLTEQRVMVISREQQHPLLLYIMFLIV